MCACVYVWVVNYEGWSNKLRLWFLLPFLLFVVGGGREKLLTKYGQVRVTDCEYIKHRQVSISVGEDRPAVAVAESESKLPSPSRSQSQSQFMWQKCHSQRKETKRDLLYFTLISSAQDLQNITTSPPRALSSFFFLFFRLFSFFGNGLWWSFVYVRLSSSNICFRDR